MANCGRAGCKLAQISGIGFCSEKCKDWAACQNCSKPSWNGETGSFCSTRCRDAPRSKQQEKHLLLGIRLKDAQNFVSRRVGFPETYTRDEMVNGWITALHGARLTGYDLAYAIQDYMRKTGNEERSVCELAVSEGNWDSDGLEGGYAVGPAQVYCSHVQTEPWEDKWKALESGLEKCTTLRPWNTYLFIDYFCVRQCERDFHFASLLSAMRTIGNTLATMFPTPEEYVSRAFCLLECVATVKGGGRLYVHMPSYVRNQRDTPRYIQKLKDGIESRIDPMGAKCAQTEDRNVIDAYFLGAGEQVVTETMMRAVSEYLWNTGYRCLESEGVKKEDWFPKR